MRKYIGSLIILALAVPLAHAAPKALPQGATARCVANPDGSGTLTFSGVNIKHVEIYTDAPTEQKDVLEPATSYRVPPYSRFNFVFTDGTGEYYGLASAAPLKGLRNVYGTSAGTGGQLNGIVAVPPANQGGLGKGGASFGCAHMIRRAQTAGTKG